MSRPLASLLALALSTPAAAAGVQSTGPGSSGTGANVQCMVQNLDTKERTVTASIVLEDGTVTEGPSAVPIPAGRVVAALNTGGPSPYVYCQFEGLTRKTRGWLAVIDSGGTRAMLPATK